MRQHKSKILKHHPALAGTPPEEGNLKQELGAPPEEGNLKQELGTLPEEGNLKQGMGVLPEEGNKSKSWTSFRRRRIDEKNTNLQILAL